MADLGYGFDGVIFAPDWSLLTRMAGGLGKLVPREEMEVRLGQRPGQEQPQSSGQLLTLSCG